MASGGSGGAQPFDVTVQLMTAPATTVLPWCLFEPVFPDARDEYCSPARPPASSC